MIQSTPEEGILSQQDVDLLLQRINKPLRKIFSGDERLRELSQTVNPYSARVFDFQNKLYLLRDFAAEVAALQKQIAAVEKCYLEIGSGSGGHLIAEASKRNDAFLIGVELRFKRTIRTLEKAEKAGVHNLLMLRTDAVLIRNIFAPQSFDGVWINFPDPWEKEKEQKHRVLSPILLDRLASLLVPGGFVSIRTDHGGYFQDFLNTVQSRSDFAVIEQSRDFHRSPYAVNAARTEFESLFLSQGLPIYYLKLERAVS